MKFEKKEFIILGIIALSFLIGLYYYPLMPDQLPTHWDISGQPDDYSHKSLALIAIPIIMVFLYLFLTFLPYVAIYKKNLKKFMKPYFGFRLAFIIFMFALYMATLIQARRPFPMNYFILPALGFLFFFVGKLLKHTKRNFFIGFRTPWTISSENVWKKTNAKASKFFTVYAFIIVLGIFIPRFAIAIIMLPLFIGIAYLSYYSYRLYQKENE